MKQLLAAALLAAFLPVSAQPYAAMEIIDHTPLANKLDVERSSATWVVFSSNLDSSTVSMATFSLRGEQTGPYQGVFSFPAGDQLRFTPAQPFKPGETLYVTGSSGVLSAAGQALKPYTWQFTAETRTASGEMRAHPAAPSFGAGSSFAAALGDLDGDGDLDAVVANSSDQAQTVWLNDAGGTFSAHPAVPDFGAGRSRDVALGDLDGDGDLDVVVANWDNQAQTVWLNDGGGAFSAHISAPSFGAWWSTAVALGDLDGDGNLDAVAANSGQDSQTVWLNSDPPIYLPLVVR